MRTWFGDFPEDLHRKIEAPWQEGQRKLVKLSSQSRQIIAEKSGHYIQLSEPELVVEAIRQVVDASRLREDEL